MGDKDAIKREAAARASFYEGKFSVADMQFRPFSIGTKDHMTSLGLGALVGEGDLPDEENSDQWMTLILAIAWTLHAPLEEVNDLCFEIEEAPAGPARDIHLKSFRKKLLTFKSQIGIEELPILVEKITGILERIQTVDFDIVERKSVDASDLADRPDPPGNE